MASSTKRIIVVGPSKMGKTSMICALTETSYQGKNTLGSSNRLLVSRHETLRSNINYEFITIEDPYNAINRKMDEENVRQYFAEVIEQIKNGLCLILYVFRSGTVHQGSLDVYSLFVDILCEKKFPVVGVVTYCENEEPMEMYADSNRDKYTQNGMNFSAVISTCFVRGGPLEKVCQELRDESTQQVWKMIEVYSLPQNNSVSSSRRQPINETAKSSAKSFLKYISEGWSKWKKDQSDSSSTQLKTSQNANVSSQVLTDEQKRTTIVTSEVPSSPDRRTKQCNNIDQYPMQPKVHFVAQPNEEGTLLTDDHREKMKQWFTEKYIRFQLIFSTTHSEFDVRAFHERCDRKGPTITLIQTIQNNLFGGYTGIPWSSQKSHYFDRTAFLFTLKNRYNTPAALYKPKEKPEDYNIFHNPNMGPIFGKDPSDILVSVDKHKNPIVKIHFPQSFVDTSHYGSGIFTKDTTTPISIIEVYQCIKE